MYEDLAWNQFLTTGDLETFIEYRKLNDIYEKKGEVNEAYQSQGDSNKRSSIQG